MPPFLLVLGVAQDGGHPQPGCTRPCCATPGPRHLQASLALVDPDTRQRWILDATPALPEQLARLDDAAPGTLDGILLTHAHMGHYTGLLWLGREVMATHGLPLYVLPRLATFLRTNGPWSQLVSLGNVTLQVGAAAQLGPRLRARALQVPHRDEYSETVAWHIQGPTRSALYLPDIDAWESWDLRLEDVLAGVDAAWIDGTFWADGELGRDMAEVPHPRIRDTLARLAALPASERQKVRFTHLNHTNPVLDPTSPEARAVVAAGMSVAWEGERFEL
ncbi:MAG: MBL fold metallo-hydrolase [Pseudomonadota bacterium]|nr:MBL fold metallo-hydrolase [Pseudomonadota bacterium]